MKLFIIFSIIFWHWPSPKPCSDEQFSVCAVPILGQISITSKLLSQSLKLFSVPSGSLFPNSSQMWLTRLTFLKLDFSLCFVAHVLQLCYLSNGIIYVKVLCMWSVLTWNLSSIEFTNNLTAQSTSFRKALWFSKKVFGTVGSRPRFYHLIYKRIESTPLMGRQEIIEAFCKLQSIVQMSPSHQFLVVPARPPALGIYHLQSAVRLFVLSTYPAVHSPV